MGEIAVLAMASVVACVACSNVGPAAVGDLKVNLSLPDGTIFTVVSFAVLSSSNQTLVQGSIDVTDVNATASADVSVPQSTGDILTMEADSGVLTCKGSSTPFDVIAGQTVEVGVGMVCGTLLSAATDGLVHVDATVVVGDNCPLLTSWVGSPLTTSDNGGTVNLAVTASDADPEDVLTYQWGSVGTPIGTLEDPSAPSTVYTCAVAGSDNLQIAVSDNHQPTPCSATKVFQVTCLP
jgi:hypothetical protein